MFAKMKTLGQQTIKSPYLWEHSQGLLRVESHNLDCLAEQSPQGSSRFTLGSSREWLHLPEFLQNMKLVTCQFVLCQGPHGLKATIRRKAALIQAELAEKNVAEMQDIETQLR